jgi:inhibitor of cysteine peptidase
VWLVATPAALLSHLQKRPYKIEAPIMILSEQDRGRTIEVAEGDIITVRLKENPTTGYRWSVETTNGLELVRDDFEAGGGAIGAAGVRVLEFRATHPALYRIRLKNWREWEGEDSVIDRFEANVVVK